MPQSKSQERTKGRLRLLTLAKFLDERVPATRFNLVCWVRDQGFKQRECGTAACACGWATTIREFRKDGLSLMHNEPALKLKGGMILDGWEAITTFFEITHTQAERLFSYTAYDAFASGPRDVAKRIRGFVKGGRRAAA